MSNEKLNKETGVSETEEKLSVEGFLVTDEYIDDSFAEPEPDDEEEIPDEEEFVVPAAVVKEKKQKAEKVKTPKNRAPKEDREEPAPAKEPMPQSPTPNYVRMVVVLTAICAVIALLLSVVNTMTKDIIAETAIKARDAAILRVFPEGDLVEMHGGDGVVKAELDGEAIEGKLYRIYKSGAFIGYCVNVTPNGYENPINMMVGIDTSKTVVGITIVEMKETAGVGSKTNSEGFLSQFPGHTGPFAVDENVDGIAGATISSKAVTKGVNMAIALVEKLTNAPAPETTPAETEPVETTPAETEPTETETTEPETTETESAETEPEETEPAETYPPETEPAVTWPVETQPVVTWPVETQPVVTWPTETDPPETEPVETEPEETETTEEEADPEEETFDFETEEFDNWITEPTPPETEETEEGETADGETDTDESDETGEAETDEDGETDTDETSEEETEPVIEAETRDNSLPHYIKR